MTHSSMLNKDQMMEEALEAAHAAINELSMRVAEKASIRDQFAMAALTGILMNDNLLPGNTELIPYLAAGRAYEIADAMMEARK